MATGCVPCLLSCKKGSRGISISIFTDGETDIKIMGDSHLLVLMLEPKLGPRPQIMGESMECQGNHELSFLGYLMIMSSRLAAALAALPTICKEAHLQKACVGQSTAFVFGREGTKNTVAQAVY